MVVAGDVNGVAEAIGLCGHVLVFAPNKWPDLPAVQPVAVADGYEGIKIIVGDDVALARFAEKWKQDEINFVVIQPVFEPAIEGHHGGVIQVGVGARVAGSKNG